MTEQYNLEPLTESGYVYKQLTETALESYKLEKITYRHVLKAWTDGETSSSNYLAEKVNVTQGRSSEEEISESVTKKIDARVSWSVISAGGSYEMSFSEVDSYAEYTKVVVSKDYKVYGDEPGYVWHK